MDAGHVESVAKAIWSEFQASSLPRASMIGVNWAELGSLAATYGGAPEMIRSVGILEARAAIQTLIELGWSPPTPDKERREP